MLRIPTQGFNVSFDAILEVSALWRGQDRAAAGLRRHDALILHEETVNDMRIVEQHSHLSGFEAMLINTPRAWNDIRETIDAVTVHHSDEQPGATARVGSMSLGCADLINTFEQEFAMRGWSQP
jgi:hypothetical protein